MSGEVVMDALMLSCSTGGGHHAAAKALQEEWQRRGDRAEFLDPYTLYGKGLDQKVGNCYIKIAQKTPVLFGAAYKAGNWWRSLPGKSPVYLANRRAAVVMEQYLAAHHYDVIFTTHLFPAEILTHIRRRGTKVPPIFFVATDYACIPFVEETDCDYYIAPSAEHVQEFCQRGIPAGKVLPLGIPVSGAFQQSVSKEEAKKQLGLSSDKQYYLLSGGSIGAGALLKAVQQLNGFLRRHPQAVLLVICGNNDALYRRLQQQYLCQPQIQLLKSTRHMAEYMRACDGYASKPGGLSSTEAAVSGTPLLHLPPIPGCETVNRAYFAKHGMSISAECDEIASALERLSDPAVVSGLQAACREYINPHAAREICDAAQAVIQSA